MITLNGQDEGSPDLSSMVRDAFEEQNLTKSENFIYIEPFLDGREAGLTPTMGANELRDIIRGVSLVAALIGLVKFARRRRKKAARSDEGYEECTRNQRCWHAVCADCSDRGAWHGSGSRRRGSAGRGSGAETAPSVQDIGSRRADCRGSLQRKFRLSLYCPFHRQPMFSSSAKPTKRSAAG